MNQRFETLQVYARLKPKLSRSAALVGYETVKRIPQSDVLRLTPADNEDSSDFAFHGIFDPEASQQAVFEAIGLPLVSSLLTGYNSSLLCYGQTNSGKTYTASGSTTFESRGIIPRALSEILTELNKLKDSSWSVFVSFLEIYNDSGFDLLGLTDFKTPADQWPKVTWQEDTEGGVVLKNMSRHAIRSVDAALGIFFRGNKNRMVSSTPMNEASSRSHCIFTIELELKKIPTAKFQTAKLHIVDLAGSERAWKSGLSDQVLSEAKYINKSLHHLEQVITALSRKESSNAMNVSSLSRSSQIHIPYRNSLLTSVLKDSLGGNSRTIMVATMSLEISCLNETLATAKFAQRCASIKTSPKINETIDYKQLSEQLAKENKELLQRLAKDSENRPLNTTTILDYQFLGDLSVRNIIDEGGLNLINHPKESRKHLLSRVLTEGIDIKICSKADACVLIQLLLAKLEQTIEERNNLKNTKQFVQFSGV